MGYDRNPFVTKKVHLLSLDMLRRKSLCGQNIQIVISEPQVDQHEFNEYNVATGIFDEVRIYSVKTFIIGFLLRAFPTSLPASRSC